MEKAKAFFVPTFLLVIFTMNVYGATSASYNVGGDNKWDLGVDFNTWSKEHQFFTGDILVFNYNKAQHDVLEVDEETYTDCDSQNGTVLAKYRTGNDQISLRDAKKYWFICDVEGHCLGGMRFGIEVNVAVVAPPPPPNTASPVLSPPPNSGDRKGWSLWSYLVSTAILFKLFT